MELNVICLLCNFCVQLTSLTIKRDLTVHAALPAHVLLQNFVRFMVCFIKGHFFRSSV